MPSADDLKSATGDALDAAGASMKLDRISKAHGHAFDESDDSYRRRLLAVAIGAEQAGAMHQPPVVLSSEPAPPADPLRQDGPTIEEYVLAGYPADRYPPHGYASRSSQEEIEAAIAAQKAAKAHVHADEAKVDGDPSSDTATDKKLP